MKMNNRRTNSKWFWHYEAKAILWIEINLNKLYTHNALLSDYLICVKKDPALMFLKSAKQMGMSLNALLMIAKLNLLDIIKTNVI